MESEPHKEETIALKKTGLWKYSWSIIKSNKKPFLLLFAGLVVIYSFLYGLWKIPLMGFGINRLSLVGISDYLFILGASVFVSLFFTLWKYERKHHVTNSNTMVGASGGGIAALVAGICPVCQGIALVAFGTTFLNIPTAFLTPHLSIIKALSIGLLALAVYIKADGVYTKTCKACLILTHEKSKNKKEKRRELLKEVN